MPDGQIAAKASQRGLVEDLGNQAEILVDHHSRTVADRDARCLLATVLQRIQPKVSEFGYFFTGRPDSENATCVLRAWPVGVELVTQPAVASGHLLLLAFAVAGQSVYGRVASNAEPRSRC